MENEQSREIVVVSDIHVAKHWDEVEKIVQDRTKFLNPNRELRNLVDSLNTSPEVGTVIFNGDAVDYYFADRFENSVETSGREREDNWDLFYEIIGGLKKEVLQIPGNHDYRKEPYNYGIYGLEHVNVPEDVRKKLAGKIGHNFFTGPLEFESIAVCEAIFNPLQKYRGFSCPAETDVSGKHSLFLNTGSDAYARAGNWLKYFAKSLLGKKLHNDCDGLTNQDIGFVEDAVKRNGDVCVFMHAPVIHPEKSQPGIEYQLSERQFLASIASQGLGDRIILNNGGELLRALRQANGNSVIVASHSHDSNYFLIDKGSFRAREVDNAEFNERRDDPRYIKHLTTLSLGAIPGKGERVTGYLTISSEGYREVVTGSY